MSVHPYLLFGQAGGKILLPPSGIDRFDFISTEVFNVAL
jgi:hypothetical protein